MPTSSRDMATPAQILKAAIQGVPAVKYALGISGILAALGVIRDLFASTEAALLAAGAMIVLMSMLLVFSAASKLGPSMLRAPAVIFMWVTMAMFFTSAGLCVSSAFFDWPKPLAALMISKPTVYTLLPPTGFPLRVPLLVQVIDEATGEPVVNASVYVDDKGREACPQQTSQAYHLIRCLLEEGDYRVVVNYQQQTHSELIRVSGPQTTVTIPVPIS